MSDYTHHVIVPEPQSRLRINKTLSFDFTRPMPNAWHRFWTRFFLGWRWEEI